MGCTNGAGLMIGTYLIMKNLHYIDMKGEILVKLTKSFYSCNSDCIRFLRGVSIFYFFFFFVFVFIFFLQSLADTINI